MLLWNSLIQYYWNYTGIIMFFKKISKCGYLYIFPQHNTWIINGDSTTHCTKIIKIKNEYSFQGKTFSIWRLNDLRDLTRYVSLFLFGDVHRELWKTEQGTVIGLLNANPMKPKDGSEEVRICVCDFMGEGLCNLSQVLSKTFVLVFLQVVSHAFILLCPQ